MQDIKEKLFQKLLRFVVAGGHQAIRIKDWNIFIIHSKIEYG